MYLAFFKWCFMKVFGGCFNLAETFRYELKKGAPDSIFAICGFVILSIISMLILLLMSAWLIDDKPTVGMIGATAFWTIIATFIYNIFKAAFECFLEERQDLFNTLKRPE